jgi:hypothetical protein
MKNIIIAVLLLTFGFTAHAAYKEVTGMREVGRLPLDLYQRFGDVTKIFDEDNGAVCYLYINSDGNAISCFKN